MKIIVGLGNPGPEYKDTRHNAGFIFVDKIQEKLEKNLNQTIDFKKDPKFSAEKASFTLKGESFLLVKPLTYMNNSGISVKALINFYKISEKDLVVIYDDIDLPLGATRYRTTGSAGTHNGMRSIIKEIGSSDFPRLRIGIESRGTTAAKQINLAGFVLGKFSKEEYELLETTISTTIQELLEKNIHIF